MGHLAGMQTCHKNGCCLGVCNARIFIIQHPNLQCSSELFEVRRRVLYARILRIRVCLYAHIRAYIRAYMSLCYASPKSFFMRSIVWQTLKDISGMKKCKASTRNLHSVKNVNESLNISTFRLLHKFTDKLPFMNNCLIYSCQKVEKIETVAWFPYISILFSFMPNITCDVCFEAYGCEQITGAKNYYFASSPHTF